MYAILLSLCLQLGIKFDRINNNNYLNFKEQEIVIIYCILRFYRPAGRINPMNKISVCIYLSISRLSVIGLISGATNMIRFLTIKPHIVKDMDVKITFSS
jgi:hypothetical protein